METFFKENTDILEWVDLLIEKIFTVCLLSGPDADSEFFRGRQAAEKISSILQVLTDLPESTLKEGIRQLIEQRLPDPRVIDNFPQFYSLMEDMIQSGITNVQAAESVSNTPSSKYFPEIPSSKIVLTRGSELTENSSQVYIPEVAISNNEDYDAINVFAALDSSLPQLASTLHHESASSSSPEPEHSFLKTEIYPKGEKERVNSIPAGGEQLSRVLKYLYPQDQPQWNVKIDQYTIFSQIDNLVFYISKENNSETVNIKKSLEKQGLNVIVCQQDDLVYPRRLERFIRQTMRHTV